MAQDDFQPPSDLISPPDDLIDAGGPPHDLVEPPPDLVDAPTAGPTRTTAGQPGAAELLRNVPGFGAQVRQQENYGVYDTHLSPDDETKFQAWKQQYAPKDSGEDYDLRGAFKSGFTPDPVTGHWPDTFKKPNEPTFSNESKYAQIPYSEAGKAGHWAGPNHDQYVPGAPGEPWQAPPAPSAPPSTLDQIAAGMPSLATSAPVEKAVEGFGAEPVFPPPEEQKAFLDATAKGLERIGLAPKTPEEAKNLQEAIISQVPKLATAAAITGVAAVNLMGRAFSAALAGGHEAVAQVFKGIGYSDNDARTAADDFTGYVESVALRGGEEPFRAGSARMGERGGQGDAAGAFSGATAQAYNRQPALPAPGKTEPPPSAGSQPPPETPPGVGGPAGGGGGPAASPAPREFGEGEILSLRLPTGGTQDVTVLETSPDGRYVTVQLPGGTREVPSNWLAENAIADVKPSQQPPQTFPGGGQTEPPDDLMSPREPGEDEISPEELHASIEAPWGQELKPGQVQEKLPPRGTRAAPVRAPETSEDLQPARDQVKPPVSPEQAHAGTYRKGHIANLHGMDIAMETPKGETRSGTAPDGTEWSNVNPLADYGEVKRTKASDGEGVDVYIGPNPKSEKAYVIDQVDQNGAFDEPKGIIGVDSAEQAAEVYDAGFSDGRGPERRRSMKEMMIGEFRDWATSPGPLKAIEKQPVGKNVTSETKAVAAPTTRPLDDHGKPIFHKGERVVVNDEGPLKGRHGTIVAANGLTMANMFGGGNRRTSYHYTVKTDEGHTTHASNMGEETEKPAKVVPDPVVDGHPMPPHMVRSGIDYAKRNAAKHEASAGRARKREAKDSWLRVAKDEKEKAARYQAALDAWVKKNPEAAKVQFPSGPEVPVDATPAPKPAAPVAKATYSENEGKDGVEVRFKERPDDATLGRLKAAGFRWSKPQKLWYAKRKPATLALAKEIAGEKPAPLPVVTPALQPALEPTDVAATALQPTVNRPQTIDPEALKALRHEYPNVKDPTVNAAGRREGTTEALNFLWGWDRAKAGVARAGMGAAGESTGFDAYHRAHPQDMDRHHFERTLVMSGAARHNGMWRIVPDSGSGYAVEHTPPDGHRRTLRAPQSEAPWTLEQARTAAIDAAFQVPTVPRRPVGALASGVKPDWTEIGKNAIGHTLYEDQRGVRSYIVNGVRRSEPVALTPTRAGIQLSVERKPDDPEWEVVTPTNRVEKQANEEGAKAELDAGLYQPGGMPITSASPPPAKQSDFARGDDIRIKPENTDIAPVRSPDRTVVDVSEDGTDITLDGGQHVKSTDIDIASPVEMELRKQSHAEENPGDVMLYTNGKFITFDTAVAAASQAIADGTMKPWPAQLGFKLDIAPRDWQRVLDAALSSPASKGTIAHGLQEPIPPSVPGAGPEGIHGIAPGRQTGRAPEAEVGGGAPTQGPTAGVGAQGGGRFPQRPSVGTAGGGTGIRGDVAIPNPGARPEPGAGQRPPDANVKGTDYRIEPGEIAEDRGPKEKARDNLRAIELVAQIKREGRLATREEQAALAKYVGWGGLSGAFKNNQGKFGAGFEDIGKRLQELLTPEEYATAARSTQYAHYTAEHVIRSMWDAVAKMGFKGGAVFEPGMGIGHFLGMMPGDIAARSQYQGIEMDHLTADIAKLLYPQSGVRQADFTGVPLPDNSFDLVIGNPPFSDTVIKADPKYAARNFMLHDYFFAKSMDAVRPGGLLAFVASAGTMNKMDDEARRYLAERANFLGGVRLPSTAFKKNAGTEVATDILFFQKHPEEFMEKLAKVAEGDLGIWTETVQRELPNSEGGKGKANVSRYFSEHPDQVLGQEGLFDKLYKGRYAVHEYPGANLEADLAKALDALPKDIYTDAASPDSPTSTIRDFDGPETKDGSFYLKDGKLMQYEGGAGRPVRMRSEGGKGSVTKPDHERILLLIPVRDALRAVLRADLAEDAAAGALARQTLNATYDAFVAKLGPINKANFKYRRPTIVQQEVARAEEREAARFRGELWREGSFDATPHLEGFVIEDIDEGDEDEPKKKRKGPSWRDIAKLRQEARLTAGDKFDEGSFSPDEMPDVVIDERPNIRPFMDDPESYRLRAIEDYNDTTGEAKKRRIFHESVLTRESEPDIRSAQDGVLWSLNKFGRLDLDAIAGKRGQTRDALIAELGDSVFQVPGTSGTYQMSDEYLSGDIYDKLDTARRHAETDGTMARNVAALEAAKPAPLPPSEIRMSFGMPWIPAEMIQDFAKNHLGISNDIYVRHSGTLGGWVVKIKGHGPNWERWGTADVPAAQVLSEALNRTRPRIYRWEGFGADRKRVFDPIATQSASDRIDEMAREFADYDRSGSLLGGWIKNEDARLNRLADLYNTTLNRTRLRQFDGAYLTTPGVSSEWRWRPHQRRVVARIILSGDTYMAHAVGAGKAQPLDAKILTPYGWTRMGDLSVGDDVIAVDGSVTTITGVYPQGEKDIYRVEFSDGAATECCDEHLWLTQSQSERNQAAVARRLGKENWNCDKPKIRPLKEMREALISPRGRAHTFSIPNVSSVQFAVQDVPISPYVMGVLLGDGCMSTGHVSFSTADAEIAEYCKSELPRGMKLKQIAQVDRCPTWAIIREIAGPREPHVVLRVLAEMDLLVGAHDKFIPDIYLINSPEIRLDVLRGLMDTDGYASERGSVYFYSTSKRLADGVIFLVNSFGGTVCRSIKNPTYTYNGERRFGRPCHVLCINLPNEINPFRLKRKRDAVVPRTKYPARRVVTNIIRIGKKAAQCIAVAHPSHLYVTDDFIVTHNTSALIGAGMEMRRLGLIKKPMYAIPNHVLGQFTKEFYEQYPTAKIMVADERRFHTSRRKQFIANVAQEDLDAVIITHSSLGKIPIGPKFQNDLIKEELDAIEEAMSGLNKQDDRITIKKLENKKEKLEQRMKAAMSGQGKDATNTFEELGVDFLVVDEAHMFRKLDFASRQNIKGIDGDGSARAFDLYSKVRYLDSKSPGRSHVFASGTPVTNTMGELYTLSKFMQRDALARRGLSHFDSWAASFGEVATETEPTPQGTYDRVTRFSRFVNTHELYKMVAEVMDIVTPQQLEQYVVRPKVKGGKRQLDLAPKTEAFEAFQAGLVDRVNAIKARKGTPKKGDDILLSVINDGRHAAIDLRFVQYAQNDPESKLNRMLANVVRIYSEGHNTKFFDPATQYQKQLATGPSTQMIFSNLGVNSRGPMNFSGYDWIKRALIAAGIPKNEIAFIGDYKSTVARQKLFNDMNAGKVRILIGSTQKMGTGVNAQRRLAAIHNLDPLWFPSDDEQRIGRGLRQGNWNPEIAINDYATEGTYDEQMWQMMGRKARFIEQFMRGDPNMRTMEDVGEASFYEQASAMAASDKRVIRLTELRHDLEKLQRQSAGHDREQYSLQSKLGYAEDQIEMADKAFPVLAGDIAQRIPTRGDAFRAAIGKREYTKRTEAADALGKEIADMLPTLAKGERAVVTELGGFRFLLESKGKARFDLYMQRSDRSLDYLSTLAETPQGLLRAMEERIAGLEDRVGYWNSVKTEAQEKITSITPQIGKTFDKSAEMRDLRQQIAQLERDIRPRKVLNSVEEVDKALAENAADYRAHHISRDDYMSAEQQLHEQRARLANPPKLEDDTAPQYSRTEQPPRPAPEIAQPMPKSTEQVGIGADLKRMIDLFGPKMYGSNMPSVTMKELLQNSFDAVKAAYKRGDIQPGTGKVKITVDEPSRTIRLGDNGAGMSPQTVKDAFLMIAGTNKDDLAEAERSGGFGVAKLAFIFGNEGLRLSTVRDGVKTTLDTNSKELLDGKATLRTERTDEPPGTTVMVKVPQRTAKDDYISFASYPGGYEALWKPLIGDVEVTFSANGKAPEVLKLGRNIDLSQTPKATTAHLPWADIDVYIGSTREQFPSHIVLSSGLYQFNTSIPTRPMEWEKIPWNIIMDVRPRVEASNEKYPFNNQREDWSKKVEDDLSQLYGVLQRRYRAEEARGLGGSFARSQAMQIVTDMRGRPTAQFKDLDFGKHIPSAERFQIEPDLDIRNGKTVGRRGERIDATEGIGDEEKFSPKKFKFPADVVPNNQPYFHSNLSLDIIAEAQRRYQIDPAQSRLFFAEVGSVVQAFRDVLPKVPGYAAWGSEAHPVGVSLDKEYHGVHIKVPFDAFFINPLSVVTKSPGARAREMVHTMFHEAVHTSVSGHSESFTTELGKLEGAFEDANPGVKFELERRVADVLRRHETVFSPLKAIYDDPNTANIAKDAAGAERQAQRSGGTTRLLGRPLSVREAEEVAKAIRERGEDGAGEGNGRGNVRRPDEGLAPQYSRIRKPPTTAAEGKEALDDIVAGVGHNMPPGDIGKEAAESAKGFEPPGRPSKHLSGLAGYVERTYIMPRTLATTDWRSAKFWDAVQVRDDEAHKLLHEAAEGSKKYVALTPIQRGKLHAVEELDRLNNHVFEDDGLPIVVRNDRSITRGEFVNLTAAQMAGRLYDAGIPMEDAERIVKRIVEDNDQDTLRRSIDQMNPHLEHSKFGDLIELDPQTREAYFERRNLFRQRWRDITRGAVRRLGWQGAPDATAVRAAAEATDSESEKRSLDRVAALLDAMSAQERQGYVPLMRFGDYYLNVRPKPGADKESLGGFPRTIEFRLVDSAPPLGGVFSGTTRRAGDVPKAADEAIIDLRKRYPASRYDIDHGYLKPGGLDDLDIPAIEKLLTALGQKDELFEPMVQKLREDLYDKLIAGFKKRASNTPGYSGDFAQATGNYMHWTAHHVADALHGDDVRAAKEKYIDGHPDKGTRQYWNDWQADQDRPRSLMRGLQQFGFLWELAGNVSSTVAIALHGPEVATFTLGIGLGATKTGMATARAHLYPAIGQTLKAVRADTSEGLRVHIADIKGLTADERAGLEEADKIGVLHSRVTDELMGLRAGGFDETTEAGRTWAKAMNIAGSNISVADRVNRIGAWLASYRMAKKPEVLKAWNKVWFDNQLYREMIARDGVTPKSMARFMVDEAIFVWGRKNQPAMQRRGLGPLFFQFHGFEMRYLSAFIRNAHRMGNEGKLTAAMMMVGLMVLAGALGLTFVGDIEKTIGMLYRLVTGIDPLIESKITKLMGHTWFGKRGAEMILKGPSRTVLGIDLSRRLGFGDVLTDINLEYNPAAAFGAVPGIIYNSIEQAAERHRGGQTYGQFAPLMPAPIRNLYQSAVVYPHEGVRTARQKKGTAPVVAPAKIDVGDKIAKGLGFQPAGIARAYETKLYEAAREAQPEKPRPPAPQPPRPARFPSPFVR